MLEITTSEKEIFEIIRAKLNLSDSAVVIKEPVLKDTQDTVRPDMLNLRLLRKLSLYVTGLSDRLGSIFVCVLAYRLLADLQWRL